MLSGTSARQCRGAQGRGGPLREVSTEVGSVRKAHLGHEGQRGSAGQWRLAT